MRTARILAACAAVWCGLPAAAAAQACGADVPWNLVVVYVDDLNASLELPAVSTPNIDALAGRGVRFSRAYAAHPLCCPSRAAMLAGQLPHHTQVTSNFDVNPPGAINGVPYLPRRLRDAGYHAAGVGKIHHLFNPGSWSEYHEFSDDPWIDKPTLPHGPGPVGMVMAGPFLNGPEGELGQSADMKRTSEALALLTEARARIDETGQPFTLWLGLEATHDPFVFPEKFLPDCVPGDVPPLPPGENHTPWKAAVSKQAWETPSFYDPALGATEAERRIQAMLAYFRCIEFVDEQVGLLLARLDELDLDDTTIVLFVSDHGWSFSEHSHVGKLSGFEEDIVAPLLLAVPSLPATHGQVVTTPVSQVDLYPTLMELLGLAQSGPLDGHSLVPLLHDVAAPHAPVLYTTDEEDGFNLTRFVVRRDAATGEIWKLGAWEHDDDTPQVHQLYELVSDPGEYFNRYAEPGLAPLVSELRQELLAVGLLGPDSRNFRFGTAGSSGVPVLRWNGLPAPGVTGALALGNSSGAPAAALLQIGFDGSVNVVAGYAVLPVIEILLVLDAGGLTLPATLPLEPLLHELPIGLQLMQQDPGAPKGISMSRGLVLFPSL